MTAMENLTTGEVVAIVVAAVLALAGGIATIGNAVEKLVKVWRAAKAPNDTQDARLAALEKWKEDVDRQLVKGDLHFRSLDEGSRVTQLALLALLDHGIDGNNKQQMQHAKEELQNHLINR